MYHGGYLAVPNTESENTFLHSTMNPSNVSYTWVGFDYSNNELWEDGSSSTSTDGWRKLYSVDDSGDRMNGEPVVFMRPSGAWSFDSKNYDYEYVCEKAASGTSPPSLPFLPSLPPCLPASLSPSLPASLPRQTNP